MSFVLSSLLNFLDYPEDSGQSPLPKEEAKQIDDQVQPTPSSEELLQQALQKLIQWRRSNLSSFIDPDSGEITMPDQELTTRLKRIVKKDYDVSIQHITHLYGITPDPIPARKITYKRRFSGWDLTPVAFFSAAGKVNSIYMRTIDENVLQRYLLAADPIDQTENLNQAFDEAKRYFLQLMVDDNRTENIEERMTSLDGLRPAFEQIVRSKQDYRDHAAYMSLSHLQHSRHDFEVFLNEFEKTHDLYCITPEEYLQAAKYQSKSINIIIPNDLNYSVIFELIDDGKCLGIKLARSLKT